MDYVSAVTQISAWKTPVMGTACLKFLQEKLFFWKTCLHLEESVKHSLGRLLAFIAVQDNALQLSLINFQMRQSNALGSMLSLIYQCLVPKQHIYSFKGEREEEEHPGIIH